MGLADSIIGAESGGVATAKNPRSSATGAGQFISGTWLDMVRKYRPDLAGLPRDEQLGLRNDPSLSREMVGHYADENGAGLQSAGLPVTDGTKYLAHFAGLTGAKSVLQADPTAPVSSVLPSSSIDANPFLRGMSAADLTAWASRKVGGDAPPAPAQTGPTMTMPGEAPAASGAFGFSGVEPSAAPAPVMTMPDAPAESGPDYNKILSGLTGAMPGQTQAAAPAPLQPKSILPDHAPRATPFDLSSFLGRLTAR